MKYLLKKAALVLVCNFFAFLCFAQAGDAQRMVVKVKDSVSGNLLDYVTVKINCVSGKLIGGIISGQAGEAGFTFAKTDSCVDLVLTASRAGYISRTVFFQKDNVGKGQPFTVYLSPDVKKLAEVTVTGSTMTVEVDKLLYRVKQSDFLKGTKVMDMLNRVPALSTNLGNEIVIKGRIKAEVYIEGKLASADILKTLPVELVKQIEVIEHPGVSASGESTGGIVNIILRKDVNLMGGSVSLSAGLFRPQKMTSANFIFSNKKLFWTFSGSLQSSLQKRNIDIERRSISGTNSLQQHSETRSDVLYYNINSEIFYRPDSTRQFSGIFLFSNTGFESFMNSNNTIRQQNIPDDLILSYSRYRYNNKVFSAVTEYKKQVNSKLAFVLTGSFQYVPKKIDIDNSEHSVVNNTGSGNRLFDTVAANNYSFQAVLSQKDKQKKVYEWETGLLFRADDSKDYYEQMLLQPDGSYKVLRDNTSGIRFKKNIIAAYGLAKFILKKKYTLSLGSRLEYFELRLRYPQTGEGMERRYLNLFPNLNILRSFKSGYNLQMNYSRRIKRPDVSILSQFYYGNNRALANTGNPDLVPELSDKLSVSLSRFNKGKYVDLSLYSVLKTHPFFERTIRSSIDSSIVRSVDNFKRYFSTGLSFSVFMPLKKGLMLNGSVYGEHFQLKGREPLQQKHSGIIWGINSNLNWTMKHKFNLGLYGSYTNYSFEYQQLSKGYPMVSASVQKQLFKDKITVSLTWMDMLRTGFNQRKIYDDGFVKQQADEKGRNNNALVGVTWNFGKKIRNTNRQKGVLSEETKERTQQN